MTNLIQCSEAFQPGRLHSIKELAAFLGCSTVTAQKIKNSGKIPYCQIGKICLFEPEKIIEAIERNSKKTEI